MAERRPTALDRINGSALVRLLRERVRSRNHLRVTRIRNQLFVVLVLDGPYGDQATARQVLAEIRAELGPDGEDARATLKELAARQLLAPERPW